MWIFVLPDAIAFIYQLHRTIVIINSFNGIVLTPLLGVFVFLQDISCIFGHVT